MGVIHLLKSAVRFTKVFIAQAKLVNKSTGQLLHLIIREGLAKHRQHIITSLFASTTLLFIFTLHILTNEMLTEIVPPSIVDILRRQFQNRALSYQ